MISKLEALLARVRTRAAEPRPPRRTDAVAAALPLSADEPLDGDVDLPTRPPPGPLPPIHFSSGPPGIEVDIEVQEPVQERAFDSRERLVAADAAAPEATSEPPDAVKVAALAEPAIEVHVSTEEVQGSAEEAAGEPDSDEKAPISSRRPVAPEPEERLAEMAFGTEEPQVPRHTPPPESGRLPASPVVEFDPDVTGVRDAVPMATSDPAPTSASRELVPQEMRATLASSERVADFVAVAQRFAPGSLIELLDASLSL